MKKIDIKGSIVSNDDAWIYELFGISHTSPKSVEDALTDLKDGEDVTVEINSGGGSVFAGSEIYTKLRKVNPKIEIVGLAGSAASFIAMASDDVSISPVASVMIHRAQTIGIGNKDDFDDTSDFLDSIDKNIAYAYELKTGLTQSELLSMMSKETWLNAQTAVEKGFADSVMFETKDAVASTGVVLPQQVIDKIRTDGLKQPNALTVDDVKDVMEDMKQEIINELKNDKEENKPVENSWLF